MSAGFLIVALAKPIFPANVGVRWVDGEFRGAGLEPFLESGTVMTHGWWVMAICAVVGGLTLWLTHRGTRRYLRRVSERRRRAAFG
jgi:hypothetical protein